MDIGIIILGILLVVVIALLIVVFIRLTNIVKSQTDLSKINQIDTLREEVSRSQQEIKSEVKSNQQVLSNTLTNQLQSSSETLVNTLKALGGTQSERLNAVSERLEAVHQGLGKMESLQGHVGDLQRVLTNVSTRGILGELQLGAILEDILTPDQYKQNVKLHEGAEMVDYAIRLPGNNEDSDSPVWLPIDSKFPLADYERLVKASESADKKAEQDAVKRLMNRLQSEAKSISQKYIAPPHTMDFAIMFLPIEGLYAEILRQPGKVEELRRKYQIIVAGPANLSAILTSLRVGFQTLAIEKHTAEIKIVLSAVKTEFDRFSTIMEKLERQLNTVFNTITGIGTRTRAMARHLKGFEELPQYEAAETFGLPHIEGDEESSDI